MDPVTAFTIDKGRKNSQLLIQPLYHPMPVEQEIAILYCGTHGLLKDIPVEQVAHFEQQFLQQLQEQHEQDVLKPLREGIWNEAVCHLLEQTAAAVSAYMKENQPCH